MGYSKFSGDDAGTLKRCDGKISGDAGTISTPALYKLPIM